MGWYQELFAGYPLPWKMTVAERFAFVGLLNTIRPSCAIEVGSAEGGSLQVLSSVARKVYSLDVDPTTPARLGQFPNVEFRIGDSSSTLPQLLGELKAAGTPWPFVLIDGDHRADGVRRDINAVLGVPPLTRTYVLMHDTFNPECRSGIRSAGWDACRFVHEVELDFVQGWYHMPNDGTQLTDQMWAGFALAVLEPHPRQHALVVGESQRLTFEHMSSLSAQRLTKG